MLGVQEVIGSTAEVVVSHCTSWKQFWVQRRSEEVAQLAAQLDTTDPAVLGSPLTSPQVATCPVSVSQTLVLFLTVPVPLHQWKKRFLFCCWSSREPGQVYRKNIPTVYRHVNLQPPLGGQVTVPMKFKFAKNNTGTGTVPYYWYLFHPDKCTSIAYP